MLAYDVFKLNMSYLMKIELTNLRKHIELRSKYSFRVIGKVFMHKDQF